MNIKAIEIVIAVIDYGTMSRAAEKMFTSQPNVSRTIQELEKTLGIKIFSRSSKRITLTPQGEVFEYHARKILNEYREMTSKLELGVSTFKIGSTVTIGHYLLEDLLNTIRATSKNTSFEITVNNTRDIENKLMNNDLDFAFVEGEIKSKNIVEHVIGHDELIVVMSPRLQKKYNVQQIEDLEDIPCIRRESGSGERNQFERALRDHGVNPRIIYRSSNLELITQAVANDYGFAIISRMAAQEAMEHKKIVEVELNNFKCERTIRFIMRHDDRKNPVFLNILNAVTEERYNSTNHAASENN